MFESLLRAAGPPDFYAFDPRRRTQSEISAQIALREIIPPPAISRNCHLPSDADADSRAHCIAVAFTANESKVYEMVAVAAVAQ